MVGLDKILEINMLKRVKRCAKWEGRSTTDQKVRSKRWEVKWRRLSEKTES